MYIVLFLITIFVFALLIIATKLYREKADDYETNRYNVLSWVSTGVSIICMLLAALLLWCIVLSFETCIESKYIDDRIAMYQEENDSIESDINNIICQYQNHETEIFDMSEINSPATLIQMYPELKSNELVVKQIDIFNENNKKIKELKSKQIDCEKAKFLLYFGG